MLCETKRIYCRDFRPEDFEAIHSYASDIKVVKYMAWGPNSKEDTRFFMTEAMKATKDNPRLKYDLAIIDKEKDTFVGGVAIYINDINNRVGEFGYSINPLYWRKGYATEAAKAIVKFGFEELKLHRIEATCDVRNIGSARVLEKAGLKKEGTIREHILLRDGWRNSYLYSILESE